MSNWLLKVFGITPLALAILSYTSQNGKILLELAIIFAFTTMLAYIMYEIARKIKTIIGI
ncbi:MAG: hypothetical protein J7J78_02695 [Thermoprotei archaeon]|nr:hypothetical protein [Thermoprotei archaeon]